jgi:predicted enzyme related to lactoylglutathione lyase
MPHVIAWFDIPATNFERARAFYEKVFATKLFQPDPKQTMAMFPADWQKGVIGGSLTQHPAAQPSAMGVTVFLNAEPDLTVVLARVEGAGGKVVLPKTKIEMADAGYMAMFLDTGGNRIGLHSVK